MKHARSRFRCLRDPNSSTPAPVSFPRPVESRRLGRGLEIFLYYFFSGFLFGPVRRRLHVSCRRRGWRDSGRDFFLARGRGRSNEATTFTAEHPPRGCERPVPLRTKKAMTGRFNDTSAKESGPLAGSAHGAILQAMYTVHMCKHAPPALAAKNKHRPYTRLATLFDE